MVPASIGVITSASSGDSDDRKAAAEGALHEADHKDACRRDKQCRWLDRHDRPALKLISVQRRRTAVSRTIDHMTFRRAIE
jgi:hypothetical protein